MRPLPARVTVTAPSSSRRSSWDRRSSRPSAIFAASAIVGLVSPRSTWESIGALTPLRSARSRRERPIASRRALTRGPSIRTYVIAYEHKGAWPPLGTDRTTVQSERTAVIRAGNPPMRTGAMPVPRLLPLTLLVIAAVAAPSAHARVVAGTESPDRLVGTPGADTIHGSGGGDRLSGGAGDDSLFGQTGPDTLIGASGDDILDGASGIDRLDGGPGDDILDGGFGADIMDGGAGDDALDGGADDDHLTGGDGNDTLHGGTGGDRIDGGGGDDELYADSRPDHIDGGAGGDTIYANTGGALASVGCGPGDDVLFINPYDEPGGVSDRQLLDEGQISNCEQIVAEAPVGDPFKGMKYLAPDDGGTQNGTPLDDNLLGGIGPDQIFGGDGNDVIWGRRQADAPSDAHDFLDGGAGDDTIYGGPGPTAIVGGSGDDSITGGTGSNAISGGPGRDVIRLRGKAHNVVD